LSSNLERIVSGEHLTTKTFLAARFILDLFRRGHGLGRIQELFLRLGYVSISAPKGKPLLDATVDDRSQFLLMSLWILNPVE
jgi:hypothetical protein